MVSRIGYYYSGGGTDSSGWSISPNPYVCATDTKTTSLRRAAPQGMERLFNGTTVSYSKTRLNLQSYTRVNYGDVSKGQSAWSGYMKVCNAPVYPGPTAAPPFGSTVATSDWSNQLRTKLMDLSVSVGMMFAEHKQTARLFEDFGRRIIKSYRHLRRGNARGVYFALQGKALPKGWKRGFTSAATEIAADAWLAWQYGVKPLVSDLAGSIDEYFKARSVKALVRRVSVQVPPKKVFGRSRVEGLEPLTAIATVTLSGRVVCYAEFESGADVYSTAHRLGLTNPALLLWELTPWSFVLDWFLNVGEFLTAAAAIPGLKRVGIHVTSDYISQSTVMQWGATSTGSSHTRTRSFTTSLPGATLRFGTGIQSWQRTASALSLLRTAGSSSWLYPSRR